MQPGGVPWRFLCRGPFVDHRLGDGFELGELFRCRDVGGEFEAVAVRVEEVDRLEDAMMRGPEHVEAKWDMGALRKSWRSRSGFCADVKPRDAAEGIAPARALAKGGRHKRGRP